MRWCRGEHRPPSRHRDTNKLPNGVGGILMLCDWYTIGDSFACHNCGTIRASKVRRFCVIKRPNSSLASRPTRRIWGNTGEYNGTKCPHLGQAIERDGVALKVKCGCSKQQQQRMMPAYHCNLHKRCLPTARLNGEQLTKWGERPEAELYKLCQTCQDRM